MSLQQANNPSTEIDPMQHRIALVPNRNKIFMQSVHAAKKVYKT